MLLMNSLAFAWQAITRQRLRSLLALLANGVVTIRVSTPTAPVKMSTVSGIDARDVIGRSGRDDERDLAFEGDALQGGGRA